MCDHQPNGGDALRAEFVRVGVYSASGDKRQTVAQRSDRSAAYWVKYRWQGQQFWELHLHHNERGSINWDHTKLKCRSCQAYVALPSNPDSNRAIQTARRGEPAGWTDYSD